MLTEEEHSIIPRLFIYALIFCAVAITIAGVFASVRPYFLDEERSAFTHSHQYVEARRTEIQNTLAECREINTQLAGDVTDEQRGALEAQRATLDDMVIRAMSEIPTDPERPITTGACR